MMSFLQQFNFQHFASAFLVLFAAIDAVGAIPVILNNKERGRIVNPKTGTLYATIMMFSFFYIGEAFLSLFGLDIPTFAIGGSIIIFFFGLEVKYTTVTTEENRFAAALLTITPGLYPFCSEPHLILSVSLILYIHPL